MDVLRHCIVDEQAFREAVWAVERENFRPGDALTALERAKVDASESPLTQGPVEPSEELVEVVMEAIAAQFGACSNVTAERVLAAIARAGT